MEKIKSKKDSFKAKIRKEVIEDSEIASLVLSFMYSLWIVGSCYGFYVGYEGKILTLNYIGTIFVSILLGLPWGTLVLVTSCFGSISRIPAISIFILTYLIYILFDYIKRIK